MILLVNLPQEMVFPPLNLLCLAGMFGSNGVECKILDTNMCGHNKVIKEVKRGYPIVGISCMTARRWDAFDFAATIRKLSPRSTIVMGGVHASLMPEQCQQHADVVIKGDGEGPLLDVCQGKDPTERFVPLDELPFPDYDKVDLSLYRGYALKRFDSRKMNGIDIRKHPMVLVQASRGCNRHCRFCSSFYVQGPYRTKNPIRMADEIEVLYAKGVRSLYFADDSFYLDKAQGVRFCRELVARKLSVAFHIETRADVIDDEYASWLKRAGCYRVQVGLETGSDLILKTMHKMADVEAIYRGVRSCKKHGLHIQANIIVGNEGETDGTIEETRALLKRVDPSILSAARHGLLLLPGTAVYRQALRDGMITDDFWDTRETVRTYKFPQRQIDQWLKRTHTYSLEQTARYYYERYLEWKSGKMEIE